MNWRYKTVLDYDKFGGEVEKLEPKKVLLTVQGERGKCYTCKI